MYKKKKKKNNNNGNNNMNDTSAKPAQRRYFSSTTHNCLGLRLLSATCKPYAVLSGHCNYYTCTCITTLTHMTIIICGAREYATAECTVLDLGLPHQYSAAQHTYPWYHLGLHTQDYPEQLRFPLNEIHQPQLLRVNPTSKQAANGQGLGNKTCTL